MSYVDQTQNLFNELKISLFNDLRTSEELNLNLTGEETLYVRFRNSQVRQNTQVEQKRLELIFQKKNRRFTLSADLSGNLDSDRKLCLSLLQRARKEIEILPDDPGALSFENRGSSTDFQDAREFDFEDLLHVLQTSAVGTDFTGLLSAGPQIRANANSAGQHHWFSTRSFFLDYSLFTVNEGGENKAVKGTYADREWSTEKFLGRLAFAKNQLALLRRPSREVKPGSYRTFLAPAAVSDLINMLSWGALSYASYKKGSCAFAKMRDQNLKLSPLFSLRENFDLGLTTPFNNLGEVPARQVDLIEKGELKQFLVSSRSSQEFQVPSNAAEAGGFFGTESLRSPEVAAGLLPETQSLSALGTGLYLSNLHYCNWSDIQSARVTGMTRYACFWVENGEIVAPIRDLRFDESLFQCLGPALEALTIERHIDPVVETYFARGMGGKLLPGMLLKSFNFTL